MNLNGHRRGGLQCRRSAFRTALVTLPLLFLLPSCGDNLAPGPTPAPDTDFQGTFDPSSGELEFAVESPGGTMEPTLKLVATEVTFDQSGLLHAYVAIRNNGSESIPGPASVLVSHFQPTSVYPVNATCAVPADSVPVPVPLSKSGLPTGSVPPGTVQVDDPLPTDPPIPMPTLCFFEHRGTYGDDGQLAAGETSEPVEWIFDGTQGQSFAFHARLVTDPVPVDGIIAGIVFEDRNENGRRDWDEPGIEGVGLGLELPDFVRIAVTDAQGRYTFEVPDAGLFTVILTVPDGARPTTPVQMQVLIVRRADGTLSSFLDGNFGLVRSVPPQFWVDGFVYMDHNRNGVRDFGEEGVAQVGISASGLECMLPVIGLAVTDANGFYEISNTSVGCLLPWLVQRQPVAGHIGTSPDQVILERMPPNGGNRLRVNFGIAPEDSTHPVNVTIEGFVFSDWNRNGVRDEGEPGIPNAQIQLMSPCDVFRAATTNERGFYQFLPDVVRMCPVTGVWQWMPMFEMHTTPNPVEIVMPTVPGNHVLRVNFGIGNLRRD